MRRVAVVGAGIAGLSVAYSLADQARVTLYEAATYFGGHTHTIDLTLDGVTAGVDTGFLVLNDRTYPRLRQLLGKLDVELAPSDMSLSISLPDIDREWSGSSVDTLFAQRRNLVSPRFWRMLADLARFNRVATRLLHDGMIDALDQPIGAFLDEHRFGFEFRNWYFLPMVGSIWSCPVNQMLHFPMATMLRFCHNHGLLQIAHRPQWYTVRGGARTYVRKMLKAVPDARLNTAVRGIRRSREGTAEQGVAVSTHEGTEWYDEVVLACHSDQALNLLDDPDAAEQAVLGAIPYQPNRAVVHTDTSLLPRRRKVWAAWNYEGAAADGPERGGVCLHYLINRLQPLPFATSVVVSLNPIRPPRAEQVHAAFDYAHPVFDAGAIAAQRRVPELQGRRHTWFCGAWTGYGFHEDGLVSGLTVSAALRARWAEPGPVPMAQAA
jgi:predicted NAD/FAD-binding protein